MKTAKKNISEEKENGRVYTPSYIVKDILDLSGYSAKSILKKNVIDNSCGDGAFLCEIVRRYCEAAFSEGLSRYEIRSELSQYIHGIEIKKEERDKCIDNVNSVIASYGIDSVDWDIVCGDALSIHQYDGKMDYVFGNPPYVRVHNLGENFDKIKEFTFAQGGMTDIFIVFYEIGIKMLNKNGILGYITPNSFFNSLAGSYMREVIFRDNLLEKIVDMKHYQAFPATTYTTIIILRKNRENKKVDYYKFNENTLLPYYVDSLQPSDFFISGNYYFAESQNLELVQKIYSNYGKSDISVKNGYATLCDGVFVNDFDFDSPYIIPVVKSSKGIRQKIFYPYNKNAQLISEDEIKQDSKIYSYLIKNKEKLCKRSNERDADKYWYAFGRSQAIGDTYKDKLTINSLIRDEKDLKFVSAPSGVGVYGGLYLVSETIPTEEIKKVLQSKEFVTYISLLGKYKSGGYYTYSSKDVKAYLDYKFAYNGGIAELC